MIGYRKNMPSMQSDFFRDSYYKMLRWLLGSLVINLLLILVVLYYVLFAEPVHYYANTTTGQIIPMIQKF